MNEELKRKKEIVKEIVNIIDGRILNFSQILSEQNQDSLTFALASGAKTALLDIKEKIEGV